MSLWDPESCGASAQYLRLDKIVMAEIAAAPFVSKSAVWVPDKESAYIMGEIEGEADKKGMVKVKTKKGTGTIKEDQCDPRNPPKYELCEDMVNLTYLGESQGK